MSDETILLYDRNTGTVIEEVVFQQWFMEVFYGTAPGRLLTDLVLKRFGFSSLYGYLKRRSRSRASIEKFINDYHIDTSEVLEPLESFACFNDFFVRRLKTGARPIDADPHALISPADARLLEYRVEEDTVIPIKGRRFSLPDFLRDPALAREFVGGACLVFRLAPADYHRYLYFDSGSHKGHRLVNGHLHSVSPYAIRQNVRVFTENKRDVVTLETENFGSVVEVEVGALAVGQICQTHPGPGRFNRGDEKGYFSFGGSTIVLLFKAGVIAVDQDIAHQSAEGVETIVRCGMKVGSRV